jgi:hypothetical protein
MADDEKLETAFGGQEHAPLLDTTVGDRDLDVRALLRFLLILTVTTVLVAGLVFLLSAYFKKQIAAKDPALAPLAERVPHPLPGPRLQTDPNRDMSAYRAQEEAALGSYAWVSREQGVARIPVARAIDILAEKGLPTPASPAPAEGTR